MYADSNIKTKNVPLSYGSPEENCMYTCVCIIHRDRLLLF